MGLSAGTKLGPYEIVAALGAGGMGEVYRARDTRLDRSVAIKVLPAHLSNDPDRRQRFEREARVISSLNHPNICTLYDVGHEHGVDYLVMEYLEGETLAERLQRGGLPLEQALRVAIQVTDALDKAHRQGIVHRDLKPGNVMITRTGAKLLDFGLARLYDRPQAIDDNPTLGRITEFHTRGILLGTLHYMAPEQLEGKEADPRSDIFAFGCLLYEMVTSKMAFAGNQPMEVVSAIQRSQPAAPTTLNQKVPPGIDRILQRCLAKDPEERWQCVRDLRAELQWVQRSPAVVPTTPGRRMLTVWALAALSCILALALIAAITRPRTRSSQSQAQPLALVRFSLELGKDESLDESFGFSVAFSPDGRRIAYVANHGAERSIYIRSLDALESIRVAGTERATSPFFSPDSEWIGFEAAGKLLKVPVTGGTPQVLCNVPVASGAGWGPDDTIVYTPIFTGGLFAISARGGAPRRLTTPDPNQKETAHLWPEFLPDGKHVLFTIWTGTPNWDQARIGVLSLETGKWRVVLEGGSFGRYAAGGHLLYVRGDTLFAAPFDLKQVRVTGPSTMVLEGVLKELFTGAAYYSVSRTGSLVYAPGTARTAARSLVWVDTSGRRLITDSRKAYSSLRISPDERRLLLWLEDATPNIWVHQVASGTLTRASFGSDDHGGAWSADGKQVAFESSRSGVHQVYVQPADGTGSVTQITTGSFDHYLCDWSPDGRHLALVEWHAETGSDLWIATLSERSPPQLRPFVKTPFIEKQAAFSPNGHWLAYVSDESGQNEVYVQPFPGPGGKRQISSGGGEEPAWSRSGRELFYRVGGQMMVVSVSDREDLIAGRPRLLFKGLFHYSSLPSRSYDVASDGRFVMVAEPELEYAARQINIVLNWPALLPAAQR